VYSAGLLQQPAAAPSTHGFGLPDLQQLQISHAEPQNPTTRLPLRPGHGTAGRPIRVLANHFLIRFDKDAADFAIHYDVDISAAGDSKPKDEAQKRPMPAGKSRAIVSELARREGWPTGWSYDGRKNMFAPGVFLPGGPQQDAKFEVDYDDGRGRAQRFVCRVRKVAVVSFDALRRWLKDGQGDVPAEALQAMDVVMRHRVTMIPTAVTMGRSIFVPHPSTQFPLGGGAELWLGYQQSARPCERGLTITINQAASAFVSGGPVIDHFREAGNLRQEDLQRGLNPRSREFAAVQKAVRGLKVEVTHQGNMRRKYRVTGLAAVPADQDLFDHEQLGRISVAQYFVSHHNRRLQFPKLPCLVVGEKGSRIPPEVCTVVPGIRKRRLNDRQAQEMIAIAACPPDVKRQSIQRQVEQNLRFGQDPQAAAFGIKVDPKMMEIDARVLSGPTLNYQKEKHVEGGSWNMMNSKFLIPAAVRCWAVCSFLREHEAQGQGQGTGLQSFVEDLTSKLTSIGLRGVTKQSMQPIVRTCQRAPDERIQAQTEQELRMVVQECQRSMKAVPGLLVCIMPSRDTPLYRSIKRAGDQVLGISTQCIIAPKAGISSPSRGRDQYCSNVAMKINAKLGGTNTAILRPGLPLLGKRPFMLLGADVTHPPVGSGESVPSIAGIVGSLDANCGRYAARCQAQGHREEIITGLDSAVKALLLEFYRATNGYKPERIVFYRDGVSDGQFAHCLDQELPRIRKACKDVSGGGDYQPLITFVVVQKRHNTRFFPRQGEGDRKGNVVPGTVVDRDISHPHEFDFYLVSHEGLQGTVKPTHYHVLLDENKFKADELQTLTHHLCYLYCRCTRSVSVCPPAYYAHRVAERGRLLCAAYDTSESDAESTASGHSGQPQPELTEINAALGAQMYFV